MKGLIFYLHIILSYLPGRATEFEVETHRARGCGQEHGLDGRFVGSDCPLIRAIAIPESLPARCAAMCASEDHRDCKSWSYEGHTGFCELFSWTLRGSVVSNSANVSSGDIDPPYRVVHDATVGLAELPGHVCSCRVQARQEDKKAKSDSRAQTSERSEGQGAGISAWKATTAPHELTRVRKLLATSLSSPPSRVVMPPKIPEKLFCTSLPDECRLARTINKGSRDISPRNAFANPHQHVGNGAHFKSFQEMWTYVKRAQKACAPWTPTEDLLAAVGGNTTRELERGVHRQIVTEEAHSVNSSFLRDEALPSQETKPHTPPRRRDKKKKKALSMKSRTNQDASKKGHLHRSGRRRLDDGAANELLAAPPVESHSNSPLGAPFARARVASTTAAVATSSGKSSSGSSSSGGGGVSEFDMLVAIGQVKGHEVFHFMIESLARWASLPDSERFRVWDGSAALPSARGRSHSLPSDGQGREAAAANSSGSGGSSLEGTRGGGSRPRAVVHVATPPNQPPSRRQLELLALVGVPPSHVVFGVARARRVVVPASVTCGTPSRPQVLSLRRLLLRALPLRRRLLLLSSRTSAKPPPRSKTTRAHGLLLAHRHRRRRRLGALRTQKKKAKKKEKKTMKKTAGVPAPELKAGNDTSSSSSSSSFGGLHTSSGGQQGGSGRGRGGRGRVDAFGHAERSSRSPVTSPRPKPSSGEVGGCGEGAGESEEERKDAFLSRLWGVRAPLDVLVVQRHRAGGRGLSNHATLVRALEETPWPLRRCNDEVDEGGDDDAPPPPNLRVGVFSDAPDAMPSSQADILALFASAQVIVGPHGAGLVNMVVARPCATVIEARTPGSPLCYAHLADRLGLAYVSACASATELAEEREEEHAVEDEEEVEAPSRNSSTANLVAAHTLQPRGSAIARTAPATSSAGDELRGACVGDGQGDISVDVERVVALAVEALTRLSSRSICGHRGG